jgi:hypothetical protein
MVSTTQDREEPTLLLATCALYCQVLMFKWGPLAPLQLQERSAAPPCCLVTCWGTLAE